MGWKAMYGRRGEIVDVMVYVYDSAHTNSVPYISDFVFWFLLLSLWLVRYCLDGDSVAYHCRFLVENVHASDPSPLRSASSIAGLSTSGQNTSE